MRPRFVMRSTIAASVSLALLVPGVLGAPTASAVTGDITEFALPDTASAPQSIASDADGDLWITLKGSGTLAKATLDGVVTVVVGGSSSANTGPGGIALGSDRRMWYVEETANRISAVTTGTGAVASFPLPSADSRPRSITAGPDGALWFTEFGGSRIGRITTAGVITEFDLANGSGPASIVTGSDGALWFTQRTGNAIGRITTAGVISTFALPSSGSQPQGIAAGSDGNLWFTEVAGNRIGRITPTGLIAEFSLPTSGSQPNQIAAAADKSLWFTESGTNRVGRISTSGAITEFAVPTAGSSPTGIAGAADGNAWFTESVTNRLSRVLTGVVPASTGGPAISGPSTLVGQQLTASTGAWSWRPTSYSFQWQRCATTDASSCVAIAGAVNATYVIVADDAGKRLRVQVTARNLNGAPASGTPSALLTIDGLPPAPIPTPVVGGQTVSIANGVTATLKGPKTPKRTRLLNYSLRVSNHAVRGKVRITIVDYTGREVRVIATGRWLKANGVARRLARVTKKVPTGQYTLKAVFTPRADQATTYAVATMSKPIYIRR